MEHQKIPLLRSKFLPLLFCLPVVEVSAIEADKWEQTRRIAEAQYEIVTLLIKNTKFEKVLPACKKLFSLDFPKERLELLVDSARKVADLLVHQGQYGTAHQVIDEALKSVTSNRSKASLCREKTYICTREGKDHEAIRLWERAIELEKSTP